MKSIIILVLALNSFMAFSNNPPADVIKIMKSGDGKTIETAYKVNSVNEEYDLLRYLKLKPVMHKLYIKNGDFYDAIKTNSKTIYFKLIKKAKVNNRTQIIV